MPYIYSQVEDLEGTEKVGSKQCVALVQHYAKLPATALWTEGKAVVGNLSIAKGTVIATFDNGKYQSHTTGNHAAFFISQNAAGVWVMDQWANDTTKPTVSKRFLRRKGKDKKDHFIDPSNNADAYSVVE